MSVVVVVDAVASVAVGSTSSSQYVTTESHDDLRPDRDIPHLRENEVRGVKFHERPAPRAINPLADDK